MKIIITTKGADVTIDDLGSVTFTDPSTTTLYDSLIQENQFSLEEIKNSSDLQAEIDGGNLDLKDDNDNIYSSVVAIVQTVGYGGCLASHEPTGTTQTIDWDDTPTQAIDLESATGDVTLTFSNPQKALTYVLKVTQDSTTSRDLIYPANVKWAGGTAPVISTGANAIDLIVMFYDGTDYLASINQNFS